MSACKNAKPLETVYENMEVVSPVICVGCGWEGLLPELLCDPECEDTTLWCPHCETAAWQYK